MTQPKTHDPGARRIPVRLHLGAALAGPQALTFGVPFANGALLAGTPLIAQTADGRELPLQTACMTTWDKDLKYVKWLLVDLQADPARDGELLWLSPAPTPARAVPPPSGDPPPTAAPSAAAQQPVITTTQANGLLTIDTGPLRLRLRTDFTLWKHRETDSVFAGGEVRTADGWRPVLRNECLILYMQDGHGQVYDSLGVSPAPRVILEEAGKLRVCVRIDGHLRAANGTIFCPYRLRLHLYAGQSDLRLFHTFVFNQDPTRVQLAGVGLKVLMLPGDGGQAAVAGEGHGACVRRCVNQAVSESPPPPILALQQTDDQHFTQYHNGQVVGTGAHAAGWAALSGDHGGVIAVLRDFWQEYPKGICLQRDALDLQIWPLEHASPLSFLTPFNEPPIQFNGTRDEEEVKRLLAANPTAPLWLNGFRARTLDEFRWVETMIERHAPGRAMAYDDMGTDNGIGAAKTTEILLRLGAGPVAPEAAAALAAAVQDPPVAVVDPTYLCNTGVFEHFLAAGDSRFKDADAFLDDGHFEFCLSDPVSYGRRYGMMLYGNLINLHGEEPKFLYQLYKDSDPAKALRYFGPYHNEAADLILSAWGYFLRTGNPKHGRWAQLAARAAADVGYVHAYPDDADRVGVMHYHNGHAWSGVLCRSHSIIGGLMADYYLTGNRRLLDVALEAANHVVHVQNPAGILNCFYGNYLNREFVGPLSILLEAYQATWQERYGALAERSLAWLLRTVPKPGYLPASVFTVGPRGDEAIVTAQSLPGGYCGNHYLAYAAAWRLFPSREFQAFLLANADYWVWQHPGGGGGDAGTVCLAYDITGKPEYAAYLATMLAGCKPADPTAQTTEPRSFWMYSLCGILPRFMHTVAQAMDRDPEGFAEQVRLYRQQRQALPATPPAPPVSGELSLGRLSTEPFARLADGLQGAGGK